MTTVQVTKANILVPINLHNTIEFDELLRQRVICGWDFSPSTIEAWRAAGDAHTTAMFWIIPKSRSELPPPQCYTGHIMGQLKAESFENESGVGECVFHISNLFVLPDRRSGGFGRTAVEALESWAKMKPYGSPECKAITLNALSRRYIEDDGAEWRGMYAKICANLHIDLPVKGSSNEDWYARMGYIKWKEAPAYPVKLDGEEIKLIAASLRKPLE
jgi:GNAT superfamily N-acetyltransferase